MTYDSDANAAYIYLGAQINRGEVAYSRGADIHMDGASMTVDFDAEGRVL
ncbi:DUF2283 domain-containing protein [Kribbella sp. NPDC049584]